MDSATVKELESKCREIRYLIVDTIATVGSGHVGGSLSAVEAVVTLYYRHMNIDPANPDMPGRDRFVLSKGHAGPVLYATLAEKGYFDKSWLHTMNKPYTRLPSHVDRRLTPGVDMTAGSLGNGLSVGVGMALSGKLHHQDYMTYVMLGDGEIQEGMVWEAAMAASHHDLKNLVAIVDCNGVQINGWVNDIMTVEPLADKWRAFGWKVVEVNGHNMKDVLTALHTAKTMRHPTAILMRTVKGKGVSFMEDDSVWHGSAPDDEQMVKAIAEIKEGGVV